MRFSVLSYNVLHNFGANRLLKARGIDALAPKWVQHRVRRAAELVKDLEPDVACLQEVDEQVMEVFGDVLGPGYSCGCSLINEHLPPKDGCAVFFRNSRLELLDSHAFRLRDGIARYAKEYSTPKSSSAGLAAAFWRELTEKQNMSIVLTLAPKGEHKGGPVCVATTHLFWHPRYPDLKLLQAFLLARELEVFSADLPIVLAGDLNSTPLAEEAGDFSGVYGLLTTGSIGTAHPHHPVSMRQASGILKGVSPSDVPELQVQPFRSAYAEAFGAEGPVTSTSKEFRGCLDYVLFRGAGLHLLGARPLPTEEELLPSLPLPSHGHPSDHLPLLAHFELAAPSSPQDEDKQCEDREKSPSGWPA